MGRGVVRAPDARDAPVGGHDDHGGHVVLHGAVQERETLHVEHVDLWNRHNLHLISHEKRKDDYEPHR